MAVLHKRLELKIPAVRWRRWTSAEDTLVMELLMKEAAANSGRTLSAVYTRRGQLNVSDGRRKV